jgi:hypothetical protein
MFRSLSLLAAATLAASACGNAAPPLVPRGATIEPSGFATILAAPPAPFAPAAPGEPKPPTADQVAAQEQFRRVAEFQNSVRDEVDALHRTLDRREKGNFVDLYFENEGEPHVVFRFLRDPETTLRKYTRDPRFRAATAKYSMAELAAALDFMMETFRDDRIIMGGGYGNKQNRASIEVAIPEEEFRELVRRKGVTIPEAVELTFRADTPAREINKPLPPHIAPLVRIFPRDDRPVGAVNSINSYAKVVLQDGCFRSPDNGEALVLFPLGAQLFIDGEGYLAFGSDESPGYGRVGEEIVFMGSIGEVTAPELVGPIHAACGPGKVIKVNGMRSAAAERTQDHVTTNFNAFRQLQEMYGLTEPQAVKALGKCKRQVGFGTCLLSPPRPMRKEECPVGSELSGGLCRTPEGYIRPLPEWLEEFAR